MWVMTRTRAARLPSDHRYAMAHGSRAEAPVYGNPYTQDAENRLHAGQRRFPSCARQALYSSTMAPSAPLSNRSYLKTKLQKRSLLLTVRESPDYNAAHSRA